MAIDPLNFTRTTLRAPIGTSDTQLLLAVGSAPMFDIPSGDYFFITVNDSTTVEIMRYTSTGSVVNDTINVTRAQDNTTAKSFPAGACVTSGWNIEQLHDYVLQITTAATPSNTQMISGSGAVPVDEPTTPIIYTINTTTGQLWFWNGSSWSPVTSNRVQQLDTVPVAEPPFGTTWTVIVDTGALYYWTGSAWLQVAGVTGGVVEINSRQFISDTGVGLEGGLWPFHHAVTLDTVISYQANPDIASIISIPGVGPNTGRVVFSRNCLMTMTGSIYGFVDSPGTDQVFLQVLLTTTADDRVYGNTAIVPATSAQATVLCTVSSGPVLVAAGDAWDANTQIYDSTNAYVAPSCKQATITVEVLALL